MPKLDSPLAPDADDQAALRQVLDYYHARLKENPAALAYLQKRGIGERGGDRDVPARLRRSHAGLRLPQEQPQGGAALRARLTRLGILRDTGHEHLRGRVVFPVIAENGGIGTVYGRAIDDGGKHDRHLFLPGPQRGVWNPACAALARGDRDRGDHRRPDVVAARVPARDDGLQREGAARGTARRAHRGEGPARVPRRSTATRPGDEGTAAAAAQLAAHGIEASGSCSRRASMRTPTPWP